jgi:hypothetical protein
LNNKLLNNLTLISFKYKSILNFDLWPILAIGTEALYVLHDQTSEEKKLTYLPTLAIIHLIPIILIHLHDIYNHKNIENMFNVRYIESAGHYLIKINTIYR